MRKIFDTINGHLAEKGLMMSEGSIVDATLIAAPPSTKNKEGKRDSDTPSVKIVVVSSNWSSNLPWGDGFDDDKIHQREERACAQPDERAA